MNSNIEWYQSVFGKLVQFPNGPIINQTGYQCTGRSAEIPVEIRKFCDISSLNLGVVENFDWTSYPWLVKGGGIVSRSIVVDSIPYMCIGRVNVKSEKGTGYKPPYHFFHQAHYIVSKAEKIHFPPIVDLTEHLHVNPMVNVNYNLPLISLESNLLDKPLPRDWHEKISDILMLIMSGYPYCLHNPDMEIEDFLEMIRIVFCALPPTLIWRIPFGAGLAYMDGSVAIGMGINAYTQTRVIRDELKGIEDLDVSRGVTYLNWIEEVSNNCITYFDLYREVSERLEIFDEYNSIPIEKTWQDACLEVADSIIGLKEFEAYKRWITKKSQECPVFYSKCYSADKLKITLDYIEDKGQENIQTFLGREWLNVWTEISEAASNNSEYYKSLGKLLGVFELDQPEELLQVINVDLPQTIITPGIRSLNNCLKNSSNGELWESLLVKKGKAAWFNEWKEDQYRELLSLALNDYFQKRSNKLFKNLPRRSLTETAVLLLRGKYVDENDLDDFMEEFLKSNTEILSNIIYKNYEDGSMLSALHLAKRAREYNIQTSLNVLFEDDLQEILEDDRLEYFTQKLAKEIFSRKKHLSEYYYMRILLLGWEHLSTELKEKLEKHLSDRIGQPYAYLLLGSRNLKAVNIDNKEYKKMVLSIIKDKLFRNIGIDYRLLDLIICPPDDSYDGGNYGTIKSLFYFFLGNLKPECLKNNYNQALPFIRDLIFSSYPINISQYDTLEMNLDFIADVLNYIEKNVSLKKFFVQSHEEMRYLLELLSRLKYVDPDYKDNQLKLLLSLASDNLDDYCVLKEFIDRKSFNHYKGWRLIIGSSTISELHDSEKNILRKLSGAVILWIMVMNRSINIHRALMEKVKIEDFWTLQRDFITDDILGKLCFLAQKKNSESFGEVLFKWKIEYEHSMGTYCEFVRNVKEMLEGRNRNEMILDCNDNDLYFITGIIKLLGKGKVKKIIYLKIRCHSCGFKNSIQDKFCVRCGVVRNSFWNN